MKRIKKIMNACRREVKDCWGEIVIILIVIALNCLFVGGALHNNTSYTEWGGSLSEIEPGVYGMYSAVHSNIPAQNCETITVCCDGEIRNLKGIVSICYTDGPARIEVKDYNIINRDEISVFVPDGSIQVRESVGIGR